MFSGFDRCDGALGLVTGTRAGRCCGGRYLDGALVASSISSGCEPSEVIASTVVPIESTCTLEPLAPLMAPDSTSILSTCGTGDDTGAETKAAWMSGG